MQPCTLYCTITKRTKLMAKIIILGSSGQLGYDLRKVFSNSSHEIIALTSKDFDVTTQKPHEALSKYTNIDYIINCIATTNVDGCEDSPELAFQVNSIATLNLAKYCTQNNITLIHISTDYVFDGSATTPYAEDSKTNPLNIYGLSKLAGDTIVTNYASKYFIFRVSSLFGVAGASGKGGNFVTTMLRLAQEKDSWTVIDDQITCPTHTLDIARVIKTFIDKNIDEYGVYNCVSNNSCSWFEFTREILRQTNLDANKVKPISYKEYAFKAKRPQYGVMSTNKLSKYYTMPSYQEALAEYFIEKESN